MFGMDVTQFVSDECLDIESAMEDFHVQLAEEVHKWLAFRTEGERNYGNVVLSLDSAEAENV